MRAVLNYRTPSLFARSGLSLFDEALSNMDKLWFASDRSSVDLRNTEIQTDEHGWTVQADLPGIEPENLKIEADGDTLSLSAERVYEAPEGFRAVQRERSSTRYQRTWRFGSGIDADGVKAHLDDGRLTIQVPKRAEARVRTITVASGK